MLYCLDLDTFPTLGLFCPPPLVFALVLALVGKSMLKNTMRLDADL